MRTILLRLSNFARIDPSNIPSLLLNMHYYIQSKRNKGG